MTTLQRYSRHLVLPQIDVAGQQTLLDSHALIVGAGGLGSAAALYLAAAGVGRLTIADSDVLELSNLQRQILHRSADLGRAKAESARDTLHALNPEVQVEALSERLEGLRLQKYVNAADVVLDGSDNFPTRFAVNAACVAARKPLVSGAAIRFEAQLAVFTPGRNDSPCYRCLYRENGEAQESCENSGILGPLVGVIGSLQALEAIKLLLGIGSPSSGRLLVLDALSLNFRELKLRRDPDCPVCNNP
ncbi:MAG: HesA/MoeB/ThiF family protein [Nevskiales bacterium]